MGSKLSNFINLLSKLTLLRVGNGVQVLASYYVSKITKKPTQWGMPISLSIEPTTSCNLRCPECPSGKREFTRETGMLEVDFFKSTIDQLQRKLLYITFYFQGEPYLNSNLLEMVHYAKKKRLFSSTSTNAHYLNDDNARLTVKSGLDQLTISIDGTTQEVYEQYRIGGNLAKVIEGTQNLVRWKEKLKSNTPHIILQFLVVQPNEHQITDAEQLAKDLKVDEIRFKTAQVYDYKNGNKLIPTKKEYSRYIKQSDGTYKTKNKVLNHCWRLWHASVITWDGMIVPCCFDKDAQHTLGNVKNNNFKEIWQGEPYQRFRKNILSSRSEIDICTNCTEGTKVWV